MAYYEEAVLQTLTNSTHGGTMRPTATKPIPKEKGRINASKKTEMNSVQ